MMVPVRNAVLLLALVLTGAARGAPKEGIAVSPEARALYERGLAHYHVGDFPQAIDEFKRAYELSKAPRLLFDLAQAQRLNKDYEPALYSYTTYLRLVPDAPNRDDVNARIAEMNRLIKEGHARETAPPPTETTPAAPVVPPPTTAPTTPTTPTTSPTEKPLVARPPGRTLLWTGVGVAAGGVALMAAAAGLTGAAASAGSSLDALQQSHGMWDAHYQSLYDAGQREQTAAIALWAIGGAATVAGGVLAVVGARRAAGLRLGAQPGAASIAWSGRF
jgi:tetratricopeptide (TPR) repeat protein